MDPRSNRVESLFGAFFSHHTYYTLVEPLLVIQDHPYDWRSQSSSEGWTVDPSLWS